MVKLIKGLHHVTAIAADPQKNLDFYKGILGLRLVKKTVNFDAPDVYHFYYGDEKGSPGSLLTFFPFPDIAPGRKGKGQLTVTSFSIADNALEFWMKRLTQFQIPYKAPEQRFNERVLYFEDHEGLGLELIANASDKRPGYTAGDIPLEYSIKGLYGVTLSEECYERTAEILKSLDHALVAEVGNRFRFSASENGNFVDVLCNPDALRGQGGFGTVHHVAFATDTEAMQKAVQTNLLQLNYNVTPVLDREYFHSIYFREPGGVLFEVATAAPGFTVDEPLEHLGESLKLPPWHESKRQWIEKQLPTINERAP